VDVLYRWCIRAGIGKCDRVELNGEVLPLTAGRFDTTWTAGGAGAQTLTIRVVDGEEDRAKVVRRFTIERIEAVYEAYLKGFAVAVGTEIDAATGYPKKIRRLKDDGEMVLIPAGTFQMGAVPTDKDAQEYEKPRHAVTLSKAYYLDVNEVTNAQFQTFVAATSHRTTAEEQGEGYAMKADRSGWEMTKGVAWRTPLAGGGKPSNWERHPVVLVSHDDATTFARWAGAALPTEAQFERAQRGGDEGRIYPWGDSLPAPSGFGNYAGAEVKRAFPKWPLLIMEGYEDGFAQTAPVRSFRPNGFGACDLSGNVWEWCSDWYDKAYYAASPSRDPSGPGSGSARAARGGSWNFNDGNHRASARMNDVPASRVDFLGFRLARSL
jgi:formylglycine-generating enzyme required for sulfatase activity